MLNVTPRPSTPETSGVTLPFASRRLLVPLDRTFGAESVLPCVRWIAAPADAEIVLLSIVRPEMAYVEEAMRAWPLPLDAEEMLSLMHAERDEALAYLARIAALLRVRGYRARLAVREGIPWQVIASVAQSLDVDLIAFAARRKSLFARLWGRNTVNQVIERVGQPVVLVSGRPLTTFDRLRVYIPERRGRIDRMLHGGVAERALELCGGPVLVTPHTRTVSG